MKMLNYTSTYFAIILLVLISIWAAIFYYAMLDEIYDSIDDGLDNQKGLILQKIARDSTILKKSDFEEGDYAIRETSFAQASHSHDIYLDTLMYMQNEEDFEPVRLLRTAFRHNGRFYEMQVITSMVEEDDLMAELFYALLWLYLGLVASILILNQYLLKRTWSPFYHLLGQLKKFRLERPSEIKLKDTKIDEFILLNESVKKLLKSNINAYTGQKHFIENAAHELQTPLAISINKLEALAENEKLSGESLKLLASALDNLERLTRLNKSMLLLSRIENRQFMEEDEMQLNELVKKIADDFSDMLSYHKISLTIQDTELVSLRMNADLAVILFTNLLKNAIIHNQAQGTIHIVLGKTFFRIENSGRNEALDENTLFTRFASQDTAEHSTGLGLAIAKAITDLYSYKISYSFNGNHSITVQF